MGRKAKVGSPKDLLERTKNGEVFAASRLMTLTARGDKKSKKLVGKLPNLPKETFLIGVTGPGGTGKSTLINQLIRAFRKEGKTVGVVSCDPVSKKTGGSILGDRIRMEEHHKDQGVFIRSLAQYQSYKGVALGVTSIVKIFGAMKKQVVIVETVGTGQEDMGFKDLVEILILVLTPEGDEIQLLKSGVIETADIIALNKSDRPGAEIMFSNLLKDFGKSKKIYKINALKGEGILELVEGIKEIKNK